METNGKIKINGFMFNAESMRNAGFTTAVQWRRVPKDEFTEQTLSSSRFVKMSVLL